LPADTIGSVKSVMNWIVFALGLGLVTAGLLMVFSRDAHAPSGPAAVDRLPESRDELLAAGRRIIDERRCEWCHRTPPEAPVAHPRANCQACHQREKIVDHLAPPLERIAERRPPEWLRRYLRHPYPIRASSSSRMPDLLLSDFEVEVLARTLEALGEARIASLSALPAPERARPEDEADPRLARGRELWSRYSCATCHELAGKEAHAMTAAEPPRPEHLFAPALDLAFTRVRPQWLAQAIRRPSQWMPYSGMLEHPEMTEAEARDLAWFVMNAVPDPKPSVSVDQVLQVLRMRCNGCHYGPDPKAQPATNPEGGAGWIAGFSGKPRRLDLMSYEGLARGSVDDLGLLRRVVVPYAENSPILRHLKGLKQPAMPMGKNPLPPDELALIEDWVRQGARGPLKSGGIRVNPPLELGD
jgi:mono/diheme cytochrome c family protein